MTNRNDRRRHQKRKDAERKAPKEPSPSETRPKMPDIRLLPSALAQSVWIRWLGKSVPLGWAFLLGLLAVAGYAYDYRPKLQIEVASFDDKQPLATFFRITNVGRLWVSGVGFRCDAFSGQTRLLSMSNVTVYMGAPGAAPNGQSSVAILDPDDPVTRDCGMVGPFKMPDFDPSTLRIDFSAMYHWPIVGVRDTISRHFSVRRTPDGARFMLVPDLEH